MTTTLKGQTVSQMRQNFKAYSENYRFYANLKPVDLWIEDLYTLGSYRDNEPIKWIKSMLNINPRDRPTAQTLFSIITQQQAGSDTLFSPVMFCGLCCLGGGDSSFGSESDGERWIEEPEEQRTLHQYLSVNLDPALAQADQYSSALERNTHGEQDPSQRSNDALSNNIYPRCHNNNGDRDEDKGGFSSLRNPADHLQSANMDNSIDGMFPSYANTQGKGSPPVGLWNAVLNQGIRVKSRIARFLAAIIIRERGLQVFRLWNAMLDQDIRVKNPIAAFLAVTIIKERVFLRPEVWNATLDQNIRLYMGIKNPIAHSLAATIIREKGLQFLVTWNATLDQGIRVKS